MNVINALRELEAVAETSLDMRPEFRRAVSNAHSALQQVSDASPQDERVSREVLASILFALTERQKRNVIRSEDEYIDRARALLKEMEGR